MKPCAPNSYERNKQRELLPWNRHAFREKWHRSQSSCDNA